VSEKEELQGLDISEHKMWGYPEVFNPSFGGTAPLGTSAEGASSSRIESAHALSQTTRP
jgi:Amt family ammonium transporter